MQPDLTPEGAPRRLTQREMDADNQPRERALRHGCATLSLSELWALILRTGAQGKPITELCQDLMQANDGKMHRLERRTRRELLDIRGIGLTKAIQIEAVMELTRRYNRESLGDMVTVRDASTVYEYMRERNAHLTHEEMWAIYLNRRNAIIHSTRLTSGTSTASLFDVRKLVKTALLENAEGIILCHNHPSGNRNPSPQDDNVTRQAAAACATLSISLTDHVIVTADGFFSYRDNGRL